MNAEDNVGVVRRMYEDLIRGDLAAVLSLFYDDAVLEVHGPSSIPFAGRYQGRRELERFFEVVGHQTERPSDDHIPEVQEVIAQGDKVVAIGVDRVRSRTTARTYEGWWVHVIDFRDGRITRVREFLDTAAAHATFQSDKTA